MKIHALQTGTVAVRGRQRAGKGRGPLRLVNTLLDRNWTEPLPIYAWVIEHPEGVIVVDTGETARALEPGYFPPHPYYKLGVKEWVQPQEEIGPQLRALGITLGDVRWVIMTHLHTDHMGGLHHFPNSEIVISRTEYREVQGVPGLLRGFLPHRLPAWLDPTLVDYEPRPVGPFPRSRTLTRAGDVVMVPTPGHTNGHQAVILHHQDRYYFFAGDTTYTEAALLNQQVDGVTLQVETARQTLGRTLEFVRQFPTVYLPSHDPGSARRLSEAATVQPPGRMAG